MGRHIGKNDDELFERVRNSQWRTLVGHGGLRRAGSFSSLEIANDLVNKNINLNQDAL
ncbi:RNase A-like domain-containing protein [Methylobacterium komagatae]|uniref:RNase A-like domain-containing protein n=1 Tax=Methylobacterium komagatae TaxID=374425 RepID=A0ABW2BFV8_9HYPH